MRDKPPPPKCLCKRFPLVAPGRKVQCVNPLCIFYGRKFGAMDEWMEAQERAVKQVVVVMRELGILREAR